MSLLLSALLLMLTPTSPSDEEPIIGLPSGPTTRGEGPWIVSVWPDEGCVDCSSNPDDEALYVKARDALIGVSDIGVLDDTKIGVIRFGRNGGHPTTSEKEVSSVLDVRSLIAGCVVGSEGMLRRNPAAAKGYSYGIRFDCEAGRPSVFVSVNIDGHRVRRIYVMPDRPIFIARRNG